MEPVPEDQKELEKLIKGLTHLEDDELKDESKDKSKTKSDEVPADLMDDLKDNSETKSDDEKLDAMDELKDISLWIWNLFTEIEEFKWALDKTLDPNSESHQIGRAS